MLAVSCGCLAMRPGTVTLQFGMFAGSNWDVADANSYTIIDRAIKKFESRHPNVRISYYSGIRKEDYSEWLAEQTLKGNMPDVFMILTDDFDKFSSMGVLKNLDGLMAGDEDFAASDFYETTLNTGKYLGVQYALPYETVPELMFVNKTLLQKDGIDIPDNTWTWNDMYRICSRVTKDINRSLFSGVIATAWMMMSAESRSCFERGFLMPSAPWVSILQSYPSSFAACSSASAAMNVCARPIGQAQSATSFFAMFFLLLFSVYFRIRPFSDPFLPEYSGTEPPAPFRSPAGPQTPG